MEFNERLEEGTLNLKSVSCPETRCTTPKITEEAVKAERGSTSDLTLAKSTSTFDRISGILASFRDTRKALDESLRKNRELLEYVDGMETPKSKLNFLPSILGRIYKKNPDVLLPIHQNDLGKSANVIEVSISPAAAIENSTPPPPPPPPPAITTEDLETISTEIHNLEKDGDPLEANNVKAASPMVKPKSNPREIQKQQRRKNNFAAEENDKNVAARDYGNFDFCVIEKKRMNVEGGQQHRRQQQQQQRRRQSSPPEVTLVEESFPRRRRPTNRFAQQTSTAVETNRDGGDLETDENPTTESTKLGAGKLCLCSALIAVAMITLAVLIMLHPSVQLYLRLRTNYIHVFNPPV